MNTQKPIVWSIAGSDSGGGAGIQADLHTFNDFDTHGCTVITALTAQNSIGVTDIQKTSEKNLKAQIISLTHDIPPAAIKLGMLYHPDTIQCIAQQLRDINAPIIADPVLVSSNGDALHSTCFIDHYKKSIIPMATLITPNIHEAQALTGISIHTHDDMVVAAQHLRQLGARAVLIKGGDFNDSTLSSDYFCDETQSWWMNQYRVQTHHTHGTGCTLSAAIAAAMAQQWSLYDALILAKAYVHAGLHCPIKTGSGTYPIGHPGLQLLRRHFPWVTSQPKMLPLPFKKITQSIGRYPIVDNLSDVETLCAKGISFIQLRIKNPAIATESVFQKALAMTKAYQVNLVVNDYIDIATSIHAPAIHLGQEDVMVAPIERLDKKNIILGISAHNLLELSKAYAYHPSYLTMGPVFATTSKKMDHPLIGTEKLAFIASISPLPLVAIGGIAHDTIQPILNLPCSGAAFINAAQHLKHDGRYDRHMALPDFDTCQQQALLNANIVCIGIGGLAAGLLPYLAAAGIGAITLIDDDTVSYSNLQRQILFSEKDIGKPKATVAAHYLSAINTQIAVAHQQVMLTKENTTALLTGYDLIIDGTDNFYTHYLINDAAWMLNTPLVLAAIHHHKGQLFYICPDSGCYRCGFPNADSIATCESSGIFGTTAGMLGLMQAQLAIQVLLGQVSSDESFCRTVDTKTWSIKTFQLKRHQACRHATC